MNIKSLLGTIAPWIAGAVGGPIAGTAVKIGLGALGMTSTGDDQKDQKLFADGVMGANPDQLLALKQADNDFAIKMQTLGFQEAVDLEKIAADDRASARAREVNVKDDTPKTLAYGYGIMFFVTLGAFIWLAFSGITVNEGIKTSIDILLGCEIGMVLGSKEYYFGSSSGSQKKDETIKSMVANGN